MFKKLVVFFGSMITAAFLFWLGGYDFDQRNFWVAYWTGISLFISLMLANMV